MAFIAADDAIAALKADGRCVSKVSRAVAARWYGCQTLTYVVDGQAVNIGRLRQLATLALEPVAPEPVAAEPVATEPVATEPVAAPFAQLRGDAVGLFAAFVRRYHLRPAQARELQSEVWRWAHHSPAPQPHGSPYVWIRGVMAAALVRRGVLIPGQWYGFQWAPDALALLQQIAAAQAAPEPVAPEPVAARPVLPGESLPPAPPAPHGAAAPVLPPVRTSGTVAQFRTDAMAGRPISLAGLARALDPEPVAAEPVAPEPPTGQWMAGQPWDPGTPEARSKVAVQQHRVGILWPISQAVRGQGLTLPPCWLPDGPVMAGEWPLSKAMAALPLGAISTAATALAALPPVTADQAAALELCDRGAVTGCPWL